MRDRDRWLGYGCLALSIALLLRMLAGGRWHENAIGSFAGLAIVAALLYAGFDLLRTSRRLTLSPGEPEVPASPHPVRLGKLIALGYGACLVSGLPMIVAAGMGFDAPGAKHSVIAWTFLAVAAAAPVLALLMPLMAWKAIAAGRVCTAYLLASLALLPYAVVLFGGLLIEALGHNL